MGSLPMAPNQLQQMLQLIAMSRPQQSQQTDQQLQQPSPMPQLPSSPPAAPRLGGNNILLPSGIASPGVPGVPMSAAHRELFQGMPGTLMGLKAQMHRAKVEKFQALTNQYIASQMDHNAQKAQAELARSDPKIAKALEKQKQDFAKMIEKAISDPNSAEAQGIQRAYADQEGKVQQQQAQQEQMAKLKDIAAQVQQRQAAAQRDQAEAAKFQSQIPQTEEERGIMMGTKPSADVKEQTAQRVQALKDNLQFKRESLQQQLELKWQQMQDKRITDQERMQLQRDIAQGRLEMQRQMLQLRMTLAMEKTKIPATLVGRFLQADIIKEQVADLREKLKDPELRKFMGPIAGRTTGAAARVFGNRKVQDFYASQESMDALLAILHAYRGGAQIHAVFKQSMGTLAIDPQSYEGTLDALQRLADNVTSEGRTMFPNDPLWKMNLKQETDLPAGVGAGTSIVVSPEDLK